MPLYECPYCGKKIYYPVLDKPPKCNCRRMQKAEEKAAEAKSGKVEADSIGKTRTEGKWYKGSGIEGEK